MRRFGLLVLLTGCPWTAPVPLAHVFHGPAYPAQPRTIVALPVQCDALAELCQPEHASAIAAATRMELEFEGYTIVDSELLNAEMRRRTIETNEDLPDPSIAKTQLPAAQQQTFAPPTSSTTATTEVSGGVTFAQAAPGEQQALMQAIGAQGVLKTTITLGEPRGLAEERTVNVNVALAALDGTVAWRADCSVETGDYHTTAQAMELATRCALESLSLW